MVSFRSLLFLATATLSIAGPLQIRSYDADLVLLDLKVLDDSVKALDTTIGSYAGTEVAAAPVLAAFSAVHTANRKCYATACSIKNLTISDSYTIINYLKATLGSDLPKCVSVLDEKKEKFVAAGVETSVVSSLDLMKYDHESLSAELGKKFSQETAVRLESYGAVKAIHDSIVGAISSFS